VPVARLDEFSAALRELSPVPGTEWRLAGLLGARVAANAATARAFNATHAGRALIDVLEGKLDTPDAIVNAAASASGEFAVYAEIGVDRDPAALIAVIREVGIGAKIRTGGVTAEAIPAAADVIRFMRCCIEARVAFKATAGLHHPLRADRSLTYSIEAPRGVMYGFLNVFLAAAFLEFGASDVDAQRVLEEQDAAAFTVRDGAIAWGDRSLSAAQLRATRDVVAVSFGSCSFREPVDDLRALSLLA
ncbi:MAG TPA: hypothetical protein VGN65_13840, partial [Casimicrobiaceae bacterium]